jgi:hypothetical protein
LGRCLTSLEKTVMQNLAATPNKAAAQGPLVHRGL